MIIFPADTARLISQSEIDRLQAALRRLERSVSTPASTPELPQRVIRRAIGGIYPYRKPDSGVGKWWRRRWLRKDPANSGWLAKEKELI
jgi:hypothetical protein